MLKLFGLVLLSAVVFGTTYYKEEFSDADWRSRWIDSTYKGADQGTFEVSAGKFYGDAERDKGLRTSQDYRFYTSSSKFEQPFSNEGKTLVMQYTVKHEQSLDCGGGYLKLYPSDLDQKNLQGDSPYLIMFGPDICGYSTKKVHVIFNYKGKNLLIKKDIHCKDDQYTHVYTLIVRSDNTYEVQIDQQRVEGGNLEDDWEFLPPRKIKDPEARKPEDWDEREEIEDPEDTKPEDWEKPQYIPDPVATKPEDWDDEMDGTWEAPQIDNPDYKGEWSAKKIKNPAYKGKWVHPEIENPEYVADPLMYRYTDIGAVGFELWQVKSGTIFDNILVTDSEEEAKAHADGTWGLSKEGEKKMKETQDEEDRKRDEEKRKDEEEKRKAEGGDEEGEDAEGEEDEEDDDEMKDEPDTDTDTDMPMPDTEMPMPDEDSEMHEEL